MAHAFKSQHLGVGGRRVFVSMRPIWLHSEFQDNQSYVKGPYRKNNKNKNKGKNKNTQQPKQNCNTVQNFRKQSKLNVWGVNYATVLAAVLVRAD